MGQQTCKRKDSYHLPMDPALVEWLITGALGPALVALPINWTASQFGNVAKRWFARLRHSDGLSRLMQAAGTTASLSRGEFAATRRLLEDPETWRLISSGTVEDLAGKISACLPQSKNRSAEDSLNTAHAMARSLLEFAVADLDPALFQRVLLARLARLEAGQTAKLDEAMLRLDADLVARFAQESQDDEQRFRLAMTQLGLVLDRLPAGAAGREEVALYLAALIRWMNTDPWPRDPRLNGPVLTPAAIERRLIVTDVGMGGEHLDADELAQRCKRLVVLGGPGSGKTWLARRTARRCADAALESLTAGADLDDIELPLFTTCSLLAAADGDVRHAAVSSSLDQLGDLGGSRIAAALRGFFTERNAPTLLVIDSLDEARSPDARLRQVDTLPWRIVLTSRLSSWKHQLVIDKADNLHRIGSLRSLRYPGDVEPFVACWFVQRPEWGRMLAAQLARRADLQEAATVPLILAFYCIIGGDQSLPATRRELYGLVLRRMLTGLWRGSEGEGLDQEACYEALREWAWVGATRDKFSGIGTWLDEFPAPHVRISQPDRAAVDHVATPLGLENLDTRMTIRRFIHRSLREHLTAEYVATRMTAADAATELVNHIWYDPDWEYAAPAALAMHPERDQILKRLVCQAAHSDQTPDVLAPTDGCWELRRFLARVAMESSEADWTSESVAIISRARLDLAAHGRIGDLRPGPGWETSDRAIWQMMVAQLGHETGAWQAQLLAEALARLELGSAERAQAGHALVALLSRETGAQGASLVAKVLAELDPGPAGRAQAVQVLVALLTRETGPQGASVLAEALARLDPRPVDRTQAGHALLGLLTRETDGQLAVRLAKALSLLDPGPGERTQAGQALLGLLTRETDARRAATLAKALVELDTGPVGRAQASQVLVALLLRDTDVRQALDLANTLAGLGPGGREQARQAVVALLGSESGAQQALDLVKGLARLDPDPGQRTEAGQALVALLARETSVRQALDLVKGLAQLDPGRAEQEQAGQALVALLARKTGVRQALDLAAALAGLGPSGREQAGQALLALLGRQADPFKVRKVAWELAELGQAERQQAAQILVAKLSRETDARFAAMLTETLAGLELSLGEQKQIGQVLLALLARNADSQGAWMLATALGDLGLHEREQAGKALVDLLAHQDDPWKARNLAKALARLDAGLGEREQAGKALVDLMGRQADPWKAQALVKALVGLNPGPGERQQARDALLALLTRETDGQMAMMLTETLAVLGLGPGERERVGQVLLALLARETGAKAARLLVKALAGLGPGPGERERAGQALLALLGRETDTRRALDLVKALARLELGPDEVDQAGQALVHLLVRQDDPWKARDLVKALAWLGPSPSEREQAGYKLVALLAREIDAPPAAMLAEALAWMNPGSEQRVQAGRALVALLARETDARRARDLANALAGLGADEREQAGQALLALLAREADPWKARDLANAVAGLGLTQRAQAGHGLVALLARQNDARLAGMLAEALAGLHPGRVEREQAGQALAALLARETDPHLAGMLANWMASLVPDARVLAGWRSWAVPPRRELLTAVRRNSPISSWLETMPALTGLPAWALRAGLRF